MDKMVIFKQNILTFFILVNESSLNTKRLRKIHVMKIIIGFQFCLYNSLKIDHIVDFIYHNVYKLQLLSFNCYKVTKIASFLSLFSVTMSTVAFSNKFMLSCYFQHRYFYQYIKKNGDYVYRNLFIQFWFLQRIDLKN